MLLRNRIARGVAAGALALALPALSACSGFATDKVYTPAPGANDRSGDVDVLNAVIVATQDGHGTFLASFSNNLDSNANNEFANVDDELTGVTGDFTATLPSGDGAGNEQAGDDAAGDEPGAQDAANDETSAAASLAIPASSMLVLGNTATADTHYVSPGIPVDGDFKLGDFVTVTLTFANADEVEIEVPVVCNANHWAGQDTNPANADAELSPTCESIGDGGTTEASH